MILTFAENLRILLKREKISVSSLAEKIETTPQNLNQKLKRNNFNEVDMRKICDVLGCDLIISIEKR